LPRSRRRHYRVNFDEVIVAHNAALRLFGGRDGILDRGRIEAAVARPYNRHYPSIAKKAAALTQSLACGHGFIDGNKRTALIMLNLFLMRSGYDLHGSDRQQLNDEVEQMILDLVVHRMSFDDVVVWLEARIVPYA
jgi:death on curing protein